VEPDDRDGGELGDDVRAVRGVVHSLRGEIRDLRAEMNSRFQQVDAGFIEMHGKLDATAAGQEHIAGLLQTLINKQD